MRYPLVWSVVALLVGCGPRGDGSAVNNGTLANNGTNNGTNHGATNNGASNNGTSNNGTSNNGTTEPRPTLSATLWTTLQKISPEGGLPAPEDSTNRVAGDERAVALGHYFFYEPRISGNGKVSCASCHRPDLGFADDTPLPQGGVTAPAKVPGRHTPTVLNVAYQDWYFWDGRADTLWGQATMPYESAVEMGGNRLKLAHFVRDEPEVREAYEAIFGPLPPVIATLPANGRPIAEPRTTEEAAANDAWNAIAAEDREAVNQIFANVMKCVAAFEMQLVSFDSPLDKFVDEVRAHPDDPEQWTAISVKAQEGARLFVEVASCMECHDGPLLSDKKFHNLGLPRVPWADAEDPGRADGLPQARENPFSSAGAYSDDTGSNKAQLLGALPVQRGDLGAFRTPSLRNSAKAPPYMHAGNFEDLLAVVEFYNEPPEEPAAIGTRSSDVDDLHLTDDEIDSLVEFLRALDGAPVAEKWRAAPSDPFP